MRTFLLLALLSCSDTSKLEARIADLEHDVRRANDRIDGHELRLNEQIKINVKLGSAAPTRWWCTSTNCARSIEDCRLLSDGQSTCEPTAVVYCGVDRRAGLHCHSDVSYCTAMTAGGAQCVESR